MPEYHVTCSVNYNQITYSYCDMKLGVMYESVYEFEYTPQVLFSYSHKSIS